MALDSYLSQDYGNRELIVIDDGPETIRDLVQNIPGCLYLNFPANNLSEKRNLGVRKAKGEYIVHFDADDWSGPGRISDQLQMLDGYMVTGYDEVLWYDFIEKRASRYWGPTWSATLMYSRSYGLAHPWDETCFFMEDIPFLTAARKEGQLVSGDARQNFVATMHDRNARRPAGQVPFWPLVALESLPEGFRKAARI